MIDVRKLSLDARGLPGRTGSRTVEVKSHVAGVPSVQGQLCQCGDCDGETWTVWQTDGDAGVHLQCVVCGAVYCWGHDCAAAGAWPEGAGVEEGGT